MADPALVNKEWLWVSRDPNGGATAAITVPNPEEYNIIFNEEGTFFAQLDCNRGSGDYATPGDGTPDSGGTTGGVTGASGLTFRVVSFGPAGAEQAVIAESPITATFDDTALAINGTSGCNSYSASLNPQNGFFTIGPVASTLMACESPAGIMEQETAFLAALQGVNGYRWTQQVVNGANVIASGQLNYTLADGTTGVINLVTP